MKTRTCIECNGTGSIYNGVFPFGTSHPCYKCSGSGQIEEKER